MAKKKLKIIIRTAAGQSPGNDIGFGHIVRMINLTKFLKNASIWFAIEDFGGGSELLKKNGFKKIIQLEKNSKDVTKIIDCIKKFEIDACIIDRYKINLKQIKQIKKFTKTVVISDLKKIQFPSDIVINGFIGFENKIIKNKYGTKCFLGPKYQILSKNFSKKPIKKKKWNILATFGGLDQKNLAFKFLDCLTKDFLKKNKIRIIGKKLNKNNKKYSKFFKLQNVSIINETDDMQKEMSSVDFGLCSGGLTSYEFAAMRVPFAVVSDINHQLVTANEWKNKKLAINLGIADKDIKRKFKKLLNNFETNRNKLKKNHKKILDGFGGKRVAREIENLIN